MSWCGSKRKRKPGPPAMTSIGGSSPSYDANGNVTNDFLHTYAWDGYGRPVTIDTVGVTYDALGRMVEQNRGGSYTQIEYSPTGFKMQLISGPSYRGFVPLPGGAVAVWPWTPPYYRHPDWLGSARLTTTSSRTVSGDVAYAPFGEPYAQSGNADLSFTGMNQDTVSGEYDFPAREYGIQGRWPSPDPLGLGTVDPSDPQSWNRYAYVGNNPLAATDPTGLFMLPATPDPVTDIVIGIIDIFGSLFGLFGHHHHAPPQAAPAPPGGYGAGIDPYGTWDEAIPGGVQVFPRPFSGINLPSGSGCTYGSGWCGGGVHGFISCASGGCPQWSSYTDYLNWILLLEGPGHFIDQRILPPGMKPNVPPNASSCSVYKDGTSAGAGLYNICMSTVWPMGDNSWANCSRGTLLQIYVPNGNNKQLTEYLAKHPIVWTSCTEPTVQ
jgi:RHS repeat-associated protein